MPLTIKEKNRLKHLATIFSISTAVILTILKFLVSLITLSPAILASAIDNLADIVSSFISFIAVKISSLPPNKNGRYGHGKVEALSALAQGIFIASGGAFVIFDALGRIFNPQEIQTGLLGIIVMSISLIATLFLVKFQNYVIKHTESQAISADSAHYKSDIYTNLSVLGSMFLVKITGLEIFDPLAAIGIAVYLLFLAKDLTIIAIKTLMDYELPIEKREKVKEIISRHSFVKDFHDLRTRDTGNGEFFEFHLELDGKLNLNEVHKYCDIIENDIKSTFTSSQVVIHQEPFGIKDERIDHIIAKSAKKSARNKKKVAL